MYAFIVVIHTIVCVFLVLAVLIQKGKGAEIGAVFGSSETMFGSSGPVSFIGKFTTGLAILFMLTSLTLTYLSGHHGGDSVMEGVSVDSQQVPSAPGVPLPQESMPPSGADVAGQADGSAGVDATTPSGGTGQQK